MFPKRYILLLSFFLTGCSLLIPHPTPEQAKKYREKMLAQVRQQRIEVLSKVDLRDGVDDKEAMILGGEYFGTFVSGCGITGKPIDKQDHWELEMYIGIAAQKADESIKIDKKTGQISLKGRPTLDNPAEELINYDDQALIFSSYSKEMFK